MNNGCVSLRRAFDKMLLVPIFDFHVDWFMNQCTEVDDVFIVTPKNFSKFVVYSAVCGGDLVAVENERYFVTPISRRDFLNNITCEWKIRTNSISKKVVLSIFAENIEKENHMAVNTSPTIILDGTNFTKILIQVNRYSLYYD